MVGNRSLKFLPFDPDSAVAVEFELLLPLRSLGQFGDCQAEHRFEETGVHNEMIVQIAEVDQISGPVPKGMLEDCGLRIGF
jgi:hypothetical protein